jgi:hypothetical protein
MTAAGAASRSKITAPAGTEAKAMASVTDAELVERVKSTTKSLVAAAERAKSIQDSLIASQKRMEDVVARIESALGLEPPA